MRFCSRQTDLVRWTLPDRLARAPLPGIRVEYAVSGQGRMPRPEMSTPADNPPHSLPEDTAMTAKILTFPTPTDRSDHAAAPDRTGTIISLDAHRGAARLRRTMTGVYFMTPAHYPSGDSSAA